MTVVLIKTVDPRFLAVSRRSTSGFHRPDRVLPAPSAKGGGEGGRHVGSRVADGALCRTSDQLALAA